MIRGEKGQSATELALLVPLLLLLICGAIDFGRVVYAYLNLNMAAQEAVRLGGLGKSDADIAAFVQDYVKLGSGTPQVVITPSPSERKPGGYVKVEISYPFAIFTPVASSLLPDPTLSADSTIRIE